MKIHTEVEVSPDISEWLDLWERAINARDYEAGRALFAADVVAFGTIAEMMVGLDRLIDEQWQEIWPHISAFKFERETANVLMSDDGSQALLALTWASKGHDESGETFSRSGRCTILLKRTAGSSWLAAHTHVSMLPGTMARRTGAPSV